MGIESTWKAKYPIFEAIVAGFRGKVASKNRTLGVPGYRRYNLIEEILRSPVEGTLVYLIALQLRFYTSQVVSRISSINSIGKNGG